MLYVGLDLGQAADYSAVAIVEKLVLRQPENDSNGMPIFREEYHCKHLQRFPLGTPYTGIVSRLRTMTETKELAGQYRCVSDATGVGRPIMEILRIAGIINVPVMITSGTEARYEPVTGFWHVSKRELVSNLQVLFGEERLKIAAALKERETVVNELRNFKMKISSAGNDTYEAWREGDHDDLVLALALAAWYAVRFGLPNVPKRTDKWVPPLSAAKDVL